MSIQILSLEQLLTSRTLVFRFRALKHVWLKLVSFTLKFFTSFAFYQETWTHFIIMLHKLIITYSFWITQRAKKSMSRFSREIIQFDISITTKVIPCFLIRQYERVSKAILSFFFINCFTWYFLVPLFIWVRIITLKTVFRIDIFCTLSTKHRVAFVTLYRLICSFKKFQSICEGSAILYLLANYTLFVYEVVY